MTNHASSYDRKPSVVLFSQILLYIAAAVNLGNGLLTIGDQVFIKKALSVVMIIFAIAAIGVAARLSTPESSRQKAAIALSVGLIVLRLIEFSVWHNVGFLLGIILPVLIIWRLSSAEAKAWYGMR